jgi:hypothetical protein
MKSQQQQQEGLAMAFYTQFLSYDLNTSCVTQHGVPRVMMQDKRDDCMSTCGDVIDSADKDLTFLNQIISGDETLCFLYDLQLK